MKKILAVIAVTAALAGCGSGGPGAPAAQGPVNRAFELSVSQTNVASFGNYSARITGVAPSDASVKLEVPTAKAGTLNFTSFASGVSGSTGIGVIPDPATGAFNARLFLSNVPAGSYKLKASSKDYGPGFTGYSTSVFISVK